MHELLYFILGVIFVLLVSPIIESLCTLILTGMEVIKGVWTLKIQKINAQIRKVNLEYPDEPPHHQIGFVIPSSSEEEEYEDDDDDY
jgi:hypothetical protein